MPYLGRTPSGAAGNIITGDLKVTGSISADSILDNIILNGTDGSSTDVNDNVLIDGTDSDGTDAGDRFLYEEETANQSTDTQLITDQQTDIRLAFLMIAENQGDRLNLKDGIADPYTDETDIDTSTSSSEIYDATGDFYSSFGTGDRITGATPSAPHGGTAANMNDASNSTTCNTGSLADYSSSDVDTRIMYKLDYGSNQTIVKAEVKQIQHANGSTTPGAGFYHSTDDSTWTLFGSVFNYTTSLDDYDETLSSSNAVTARYLAWAVGAGNDASEYVYCKQLNGYTLTSGNLTLVSNAFVADTPPSIGRIHVQIAPQVAFTINDDLTAELSRDDGTTFTSATLVLKETLKDGTETYEDNSVAIGGQPSGTNMVYRIKTLNTKEIRIHGVVFQWA